MVVVSHLFSFFDKKLGERVNRYESHPPSLRTIYFPTAPQEMLLKYCLDLSYIQNGSYLFLLFVKI